MRETLYVNLLVVLFVDVMRRTYRQVGLLGNKLLTVLGRCRAVGLTFGRSREVVLMKRLQIVISQLIKAVKTIPPLHLQVLRLTQQRKADGIP
jgi:hypothetical protein